jgi:hypothetical protein
VADGRPVANADPAPGIDSKGGSRERPHSGVELISIQMVRAVPYLFFVGKLSNPPNLVRLRADSRHVAG